MSRLLELRAYVLKQEGCLVDEPDRKVTKSRTSVRPLDRQLFTQVRRANLREGADLGPQVRPWGSV